MEIYCNNEKSSFLSPSEMKVKYSGGKQFSTEREDVDYCALGKPKKIITMPSEDVIILNETDFQNLVARRYDDRGWNTLMNSCDDSQAMRFEEEKNKIIKAFLR